MSLLLDEKGPKNQGRHQGPTTHGGRLVSLSNHAPPSCRPGPAHPAQSRFGKPTLGALILKWQQASADMSLSHFVSMNLRFPALDVRRLGIYVC